MEGLDGAFPDAPCEAHDPLIGLEDWLDPVSFGEETEGLSGYGLAHGLGQGAVEDVQAAGPDLASTNQLTGLDGTGAPLGHANARASAMRASFSMNDLMAHSGQLSLAGVWQRGAGIPALEPVPEGAPAPAASVPPAMGMYHPDADMPPFGRHQGMPMQQQQQQQQQQQPPHAFMGGHPPFLGADSPAGSSAPSPFPMPAAHAGMPMPGAHAAAAASLPGMTGEHVKLEDFEAAAPGMHSTRAAANVAQGRPPAGGQRPAQQQHQQPPPAPAPAATQPGQNVGGMRKSHSALELGAWRKVAAGELDAFVDPSTREQLQGLEGMGPGGRLTPEERLQKILRYRAKRQLRNFNRTIKYQCRKSLADTRPRVRGRFARDNAPGSVMPHETKKALREKSKEGASAGGAGTAADAQPKLDGPSAVKMEVADARDAASAEPSGSGTSAGTSAQVQDTGIVDHNQASLAHLFSQWADNDAMLGAASTAGP